MGRLWRLSAGVGSHEFLNGGFLSMKKSLSVAVATIVLALATTPAFAGHAGQFGLGLLDTDAPAGVFFGLTDQATVHFGLGFNKIDDRDGVDDGDPTSNFTILGALEYDIWSGENWGFGVFPTVAFASQGYEDAGTVSIDSDTAIDLGLLLGGHVDVASAFSIYFRHGLDIAIVDSGGESVTDLGLTGSDLGEFGVAFWVK
jgi:hypothetical protein